MFTFLKPVQDIYFEKLCLGNRTDKQTNINQSIFLRKRFAAAHVVVVAAAHVVAAAVAAVAVAAVFLLSTSGLRMRTMTLIIYPQTSSR